MSHDPVMSDLGRYLDEQSEAEAAGYADCIERMKGTPHEGENAEDCDNCGFGCPTCPHPVWNDVTHQYEERKPSKTPPPGRKAGG